MSHEDHDHEDEEDVEEGARALPPREPLDLEKLTDVVDQILEQDDKVNYRGEYSSVYYVYSVSCTVHLQLFTNIDIL